MLQTVKLRNFNTYNPSYIVSIVCSSEVQYSLFNNNLTPPHPSPWLVVTVGLVQVVQGGREGLWRRGRGHCTLTTAWVKGIAYTTNTIHNTDTHSLWALEYPSGYMQTLGPEILFLPPFINAFEILNCPKGILLIERAGNYSLDQQVKDKIIKYFTIRLHRVTHKGWDFNYDNIQHKIILLKKKHV